MPRLPTGYDIKFSSPQQAQQPAEFVGHQIRAIAAGLGLPSHLVNGDLRSANYSSLRAGLVAYRQRLEQDQFGVIIPQLVAPLFARVTGETAAEFYLPAQPWVCSFGAIFSAVSEKSLAFSAYLTARSSALPILSRSGSGLVASSSASASARSSLPASGVLSDAKHPIAWSQGGEPRPSTRCSAHRLGLILGLHHKRLGVTIQCPRATRSKTPRGKQW